MPNESAPVASRVASDKSGSEIARALSEELLKAGVLPGLHHVDAEAFGRMIERSGDGHYLEIGSGHGASALMASGVKEALGLTGDVYCIDPFPQDPSAVFHGGTRERFLENTRGHAGIRLFGSVDELPDVAFSCALIDGDHTGGHPTSDWLSIKDRVSGRIMFHDRLKPPVFEAAKIAERDRDWSVEEVCGDCETLRRRSAI